MKKSIILLELIVSILILAVVGIYSVLFVNNLYATNSQNLKLLNSDLDLQTTELFIKKLLQNSVNHSINSNTISFYEVNKRDLKSNLYSGFVLLEKSSKEYVFTPKSSISKVSAKYIWFDNDNFYEIQNSFEDDKIYFTNKTESKNIYEQYKLLTQQSYLSLKNNNLYFNDSILLQNVNSFESKVSNENLSIDICTNKCQQWIIGLSV